MYFFWILFEFFNHQIRPRLELIVPVFLQDNRTAKWSRINTILAVDDRSITGARRSCRYSLRDIDSLKDHYSDTYRGKINRSPTYCDNDEKIQNQLRIKIDDVIFDLLPLETRASPSPIFTLVLFLRLSHGLLQIRMIPYELRSSRFQYKTSKLIIWYFKRIVSGRINKSHFVGDSPLCSYYNWIFQVSPEFWRTFTKVYSYKEVSLIFIEASTVAIMSNLQKHSRRNELLGKRNER